MSVGPIELAAPTFGLPLLERMNMPINPDKIVEGKCYQALMNDGPTIFKVTEIKATAANTTEAQNRRIVFLVSRSMTKHGPWTKIHGPWPMRRFAIVVEKEVPCDWAWSIRNYLMKAGSISRTA
jgi:hypothetical protein